MSTPSVLHRLYSLGTSSPDLSRHLYCLFRHDGNERFLENLQGSKLARLVDFLDGVHTLPFAFHQFMKHTPQAVSVISAKHDISRRYLHSLQVICSHHSILPSSYFLSGEAVRVGDGPIAVGAIADVWEGTYLTKKVSVKCLKIPLGNSQTSKVRVGYRTSLSRPLKNTCAL